MRQYPTVSLFVRPLCWTDQHTELLGTRFNELPICDAPMPVNEPGSQPSRGHMQPSKTITTLSETLTNILSHKLAQPAAMCNAVRTVMATLWPATFCRSFLGPDLPIYFGDRVYNEAARAQIMWAYPGVSFIESQTSSSSSLSTEAAYPDLDESQAWGRSQPRDEFESASVSVSEAQQSAFRRNLSGYPMVCYMGKDQLASIRRNMFRVVPGPKGNEPVYRLHRLRSKNVEPRNADEDSHVIAIMLSMAQKHFYPVSRTVSVFRKGRFPAKYAMPFRDLTLRVMTHDTETAEFIVYTGHITALFLERFRQPHRVPTAAKSDEDLGVQIDYARVPIWPILGLRERLGKALGEDLVGPFDPDAMETWEEDIVEAPSSSGGKRKRPALGEVVNDSFRESDEERPSQIRKKKQCIRRGPALQAAA
ncbi:hypothetical protein ISF_03072 [Cordyceps fumosorosea ARSEF 2679]|uniref:Uncharacterized protein n=1 Tax=Cordyceps fumosorosea (strain ARSEF 2679) TaxID=1081104 RepID=A0A162JJ56_CORFA|nr:hypothetical protein ISF_03072 [Cordyceps fumosorosea ARSEF 2679]OAA69802.1 hypothetical protein ISF_03072 [Cordyceps fumosorosea ARSEF 2679]